jgi:hypothetical protein
MRLYVSRRGHVGVGFGLIGGLLYLMFYALAIFAMVSLVAAAFLVAILVAAIVAGVNQLLIATSKKYRARRDRKGPVRPFHRVNSKTSRTLKSTTSSKKSKEQTKTRPTTREADARVAELQAKSAQTALDHLATLTTGEQVAQMVDYFTKAQYQQTESGVLLFSVDGRVAVWKAIDARQKALAALPQSVNS